MGSPRCIRLAAPRCHHIAQHRLAAPRQPPPPGVSLPLACHPSPLRPPSPHWAITRGPAAARAGRWGGPGRQRRSEGRPPLPSRSHRPRRISHCPRTLSSHQPTLQCALDGLAGCASIFGRRGFGVVIDREPAPPPLAPPTPSPAPSRVWLGGSKRRSRPRRSPRGTAIGDASLLLTRSARARAVLAPAACPTCCPDPASHRPPAVLFRPLTVSRILRRHGAPRSHDKSGCSCRGKARRGSSPPRGRRPQGIYQGTLPAPAAASPPRCDQDARRCVFERCTLLRVANQASATRLRAWRPAPSPHASAPPGCPLPPSRPRH